MSHYAIFAWRAWGHCRPELVFATRLIRLHPHLRITIFLPEVCKELYGPMLAKCGLSVEQRTRLEAVEYPLKLEGWKRDRRSPAEDDETLWKYCNLVGSELLVHYEGWLKASTSTPDILLVDCLLLRGNKTALVDATARLGTKKPKMGGIYPLGFAYTASTMPDLVTPLMPAIQSYMQLTTAGMTDEEAFRKTIVDSSSRFHKALGVDMYLWECDPNESSLFAKHMRTYNALLRLGDPADFHLSLWPSPSALRPRFAPLPSAYDKFIHIGPQLLPDWKGTGSDESAPQSGAGPVDLFLDAQEENSVLYVAFGTMFCPPSASQFRVLLEALRDAGLRVIMAKPAVIDKQSFEFIEGWCQQNKGLLVPWVDQVHVLGHKAVAGFMTHGGANSAMEAMVKQVPMIMWPGGWDQPFVANEIEVLGIAHELVQVRTGHNVGKVTAKGVKIVGTDEAFKEELAVALSKLNTMRERCRTVGAAVIEDMEQGEAHRSMLRLGQL